MKRTLDVKKNQLIATITQILKHQFGTTSC